ncbi:MAG: tetratricopeptide repeat protein [Deltaproteobacteria bacterium]|nr:tetratricopeptide repeat protein [Deltaproteobacteria bacterium]
MTTPSSPAVHRVAATVLGIAVGWPMPALAQTGPTAAASDVAEAVKDASPTEVASPPADDEAGDETKAGDEPADDQAEPDDPGGDAVRTPQDMAARQREARVQKATRHYLAGDLLFDQGRYAEAVEEYEQSYAAVPNAGALYNIAYSHELARNPVEAVHALERYLELPDCTSADQLMLDCADRREQAQRAMDEQRRLVGELRLELDEGVDLREIRVAGRPVPRVDFPLLLLPGSVDVELFGREPEQRRRWVVTISAGEPYTLYVAPFETEPVITEGSGRDAELERFERDRRQRRLRTSFWVGTGLTGLSGIALAVLGGATLYEHRRFRIEKCEPICDEEPEYPYPANHRENFLRYKPIANTMVGVTVGLAVGTALIGAFAFGRRNNEPQPGERAQVRLQGPGLVVRW